MNAIEKIISEQTGVEHVDIVRDALEQCGGNHVEAIMYILEKHHGTKDLCKPKTEEQVDSNDDIMTIDKVRMICDAKDTEFQRMLNTSSQQQEQKEENVSRAVDNTSKPAADA